MLTLSASKTFLATSFFFSLRKLFRPFFFSFFLYAFFISTLAPLSAMLNDPEVNPLPAAMPVTKKRKTELDTPPSESEQTIQMDLSPQTDKTLEENPSKKAHVEAPKTLTENLKEWIFRLHKTNQTGKILVDKNLESYQTIFRNMYSEFQEFPGNHDAWIQAVLDLQPLVPERFRLDHFALWPQQRFKSALAAQFFFQAALDGPHRKLLSYTLLPLYTYAHDGGDIQEILEDLRPKLIVLMKRHTYMRKRFTAEALFTATRLRHPIAGLLLRAYMQSLSDYYIGHFYIKEPSALPVDQDYFFRKMDSCLAYAFQHGTEALKICFPWNEAPEWKDLEGDDMDNEDKLKAKAEAGLVFYYEELAATKKANDTTPHFWRKDNPVMEEVFKIYEKAMYGLSLSASRKYSCLFHELISTWSFDKTLLDEEEKQMRICEEYHKKRAITLGRFLTCACDISFKNRKFPQEHHAMLHLLMRSLWQKRFLS
eukprot:m.64214 g.64214  ORF g.64214 m.64214 type:complete len:482 (+) comp11631_c0_seq1:161-1606(+)